MSQLFVYFDGSCGPRNPGGTAAWGYVVKNEDGESIRLASGRVGRGKDMTNNVAEYCALLEAMKWIKTEHPDDDVIFFGDSSLVVDQMRGESKARKGKYLPWYEQAVQVAKESGSKWKFHWINRAMNTEADQLSQYYRF